MFATDFDERGTQLPTMALLQRSIPTSVEDYQKRGHRLMTTTLRELKKLPAISDIAHRVNAEATNSLYTITEGPETEARGVGFNTFAPKTRFVGKEYGPERGSKWKLTLNAGRDVLVWSSERVFEGSMHLNRIIEAYLYLKSMESPDGIGLLRHIWIVDIDNDQWRDLTARLGYTKDEYMTFYYGQLDFFAYMGTEISRHAVYVIGRNADRFEAGISITSVTINPNRFQMTINIGQIRESDTSSVYLLSGGIFNPANHAN